jgi:FKBP-type peptidyl-prolyl cis-trans isomerase
MAMTRWYVIALGALGVCVAGVFFGGCQEPTEMVPAGMPGDAFARVPPPEKDEPQAKGESAGQTPVDASKKQAVAGTVSPATAPGETKTTPSGVKYETLKPGDGPEVKPGQTATVHYTGTLSDGKVFDSSRTNDEPFTVTLDQSGGVIQGWIEAIPGMRVGERRKLTIPPELAYGEAGRPPTIPAKSTLVFEVDLISIK